MNVYRVEVIVKQTLTYVIEAPSQEDAESEALDKAENGEQAQGVEEFSGYPFVYECEDVSQEYRDHDADNDRERAEKAGL